VTKPRGVVGQIFDAVVIVTSFTVDVVFVGGVSGDHGQKAAAAAETPRRRPSTPSPSCLRDWHSSQLVDMVSKDRRLPQRSSFYWSGGLRASSTV